MYRIFMKKYIHGNFINLLKLNGQNFKKFI